MTDLELDQQWQFIDLGSDKVEVRVPRQAKPDVNVGDIVSIYGSAMQCVQMNGDMLIFHDAEREGKPED